MFARRRHQHEEWRRLMLAVQDGEPASFARLLDAAAPFLRSVARRRLDRRRDAERAAQQAMLTIHRLRRAYDPDRPIAPWLSAIVEAEAQALSDFGPLTKGLPRT